ncbi:MAG: dihydroorotase [Phycisphaerae bacterium]
MSQRQLLLLNGTIVDPARGMFAPGDLLIQDGRIAQVGIQIRDMAPAAARKDVAGCLVTPGLIDMHVHLREPGQEHKETIATGMAAAVAGGFTTICCMPNTVPALDNETQIEYVLTQAQREGTCRVLPFGAITKGRQGIELAEMQLMHDAGAIGFSDDGVGVASAAVMQKALSYVRMFDGLISQHCEEPTLSGGAMHAGITALRLGLGGISSVSEELMIARDLLLNQRIGTRYHVQHISTAGAVELIRRAKQQGQAVTAEVTPHHLLLTDESCGDYNTHYKMNPPLRSHADVEACLAGVADGTIEVLATDHAPHAAEEKELEFDRAPFGIVGLETALALYAEALVKTNRLNWLKLIGKMTAAPARVLKLRDSGALAVGAPADITIIDPNKVWKIDPTRFMGKSRNTPFAGRMVTGQVRMTYVAGRCVYQATD